ncbi:phosphatases II, partial [Clavulina sp. PMI_390]
MDAIRVAKVDRVLYSKPGLRVEGTLHLTAHHIIFKYATEAGSEQEIWVPYPLVSTVVRLPLSLHGQSPIAFRSRTFEYFSLTFSREKDSIDVFESVKELTVAPSVTSLYAFFYEPSTPYTVTDGWSLYSLRDEFARMGLGSRTKAWRFTDVNKDYSICPTYPARLVVPAKISDSTLSYGAKYRSKGRIPALVYLHWNNQASSSSLGNTDRSNIASITRSSQPTVGLTNSRSIQDEKLVEAVFQSHHMAASPYATVPSPKPSQVYGATSTNIIIDARSASAGVANVARGGGTENMDYYKEGKKVYLGIENIHAMRDSLKIVADTLREADTIISGSDTPSVLDRQALRRSGWLKHLSAILDGSLIIVKNVHVNSSHVLVHCSDGWDRTAQLSSISQLCLDPYYRTYRGFQVLVEKDWVSFGHRFLDRCGHLSSEKFFLAPSGDGSADSGAGAFLASVQNKFASPSHLKETSPVFHQFLECVRQIQRQFPARFEFNERFLERLHYHLYSCQYGTFLFNNERDRRVAPDATSQPAFTRTHSVWDELNSEPDRSKYINPDYDPNLDARDGGADRTGDLGVLFPDPRDVKFWHELYGRTDEEMNGRITAAAHGADLVGPIEGAADDSAQPSTPSRIALTLTDDIDATAEQIVSHPDAHPHQMGSSSNGAVAPAGAAPAFPMPGTPSSPIGSGLSGTRSPSPSVPSAGSSGASLPPSVHMNDAGTSPWASLAPPPITSRPASPARRGTANTGGLGGLGGGVFAATAAGGVKSLWGSLSSNASAAFSAVQDAYDKNAKDFIS